jgi:hypothetical protein
LILLELADCMVHFKQRNPTPDEIKSLNQYCLIKDDIPWNPSIYSDQFAFKFYKQVIDNEQNFNSLNSKS